MYVLQSLYVRNAMADAMKEKCEDVQQEVVVNSEQQAQILKWNLKKGVTGFYKIVLRIEAYYWLYAFYAFYAVCETIVFFIVDFIASILNIFLPFLGAGKIKRTSFFACIIVAGYSLIVQDFQYFDLSFLYHFFRGQNTVKLYSVGLSIMIFEIMLTTTGRTYFQKLPKIIINSRTKLGEIWLEVVLSFLYSIIHFFIIYIDFVLFVIILNSTASNRFLYLFGINIGKLKTAVFKKFDKKTFKNNVLFDAKDRFHKLTFSVFFILTMEQRYDLQLSMTILKALAFSSVIDYLRTLAFLSIGGQLNQIRDIRIDLINEIYLRGEGMGRHETIMKCLRMDFTVIPYILFLFKFLHIVFQQIKKMDFNLIVTYIFIIFIAATLIVKLLLFLLRKKYKALPKLLKKKQSLAKKQLI